MTASQTGWPFLVSTGLYLGIITKAHFGLTGKSYTIFQNVLSFQDLRILSQLYVLFSLQLPESPSSNEYLRIYRGAAQGVR
jgi:hypothetical protein